MIFQTKFIIQFMNLGVWRDWKENSISVTESCCRSAILFYSEQYDSLFRIIVEFIRNNRYDIVNILFGGGACLII